MYSIWIVTQSRRELDGCINVYEMAETQLTDHHQENIYHYDKIGIVFIYLGNNHQVKDKYVHYDELLSPLLLLFTNQVKDAKIKQDILHSEYGFKKTENLEKSVNMMCNLSDGIEERAIKQTTKKVTKKVIKENNLKHIKNLKESLHITGEEAMKLLKIPVQEQDELLKELK